VCSRFVTGALKRIEQLFNEDEDDEDEEEGKLDAKLLRKLVRRDLYRNRMFSVLAWEALPSFAPRPLRLTEQKGAHEAKDHREVRGRDQAERPAVDRRIRETAEHPEG
jgi:predicted component of type VI protein secretion system